MAKIIKTDSAMVRMARQIDTHLDAIRNLIEDLEEAEHPGARDFIRGLDSNGLTAFAWATHIVHIGLSHPDKWETDGLGIHYKKKDQ